MKKLFSLIILIAFNLSSFTSNADKINALFLGNSYTYFNGGMQNMIAGIATSLGDTLTHDNNTPGGYTANQHSTNATTISKINQGAWDFISIQCQSQEPSFSPGQVSTGTYPYVKRLDSLIQATNSCAETLLFMTWGRKNGDASNCANYPPICTYNGMQQRLRESYLLFADSLNASVSPVGVAWKKMRDLHPSIDLYTADESHPSVNGSYLAACVFYCSMFRKSCVGSMYLPGGVGNGDAFIIQQIASNVVLDSLENWQGNGNIPKASFTFTTSQNNVTFTNTSLRYQSSSWNFGDGTPINNNQSPLHLYPTTTGSLYNVCLTVTNSCGKTDSTCETISLAPNKTNEFSLTDKIIINQSRNFLWLTNNFANGSFSVIDMNGKEIMRSNLPLGEYNINKNRFVHGIYLIKVMKDKQLVKVKKFFVY